MYATHARNKGSCEGNKPIYKPIRVANFLYHIQCDLVDFRSTPCALLEDKYKLLLVIKDLFTRFVWLNPLKSKKGNEDSYVIYKILLIFVISLRSCNVVMGEN